MLPKGTEAAEMPNRPVGTHGFRGVEKLRRRLTGTRGLPQKRREGPLIDSGRRADFGMPHVFAVTFEQPLRILQGLSPEEPELHVIRGGIDVRYGPVTADPAPVSPLHRFAQAGLHALYQAPKAANDRLIPGSLVFEVFIEARICLHPHLVHARFIVRIKA